MVIVWFRQDLRLRDNPALYYAAKQHSKVIPVYIYDNSLYDLGGASRWWLHHSLVSLENSFKQRKIHFFIFYGSAQRILLNLAKEHNAEAIFWNQSFDPHVIAQDLKITSELTVANIKTKIFNASLLYNPNVVKNKKGGPYKVFSQFWKACQKIQPERNTVLPVPKLLGIPPHVSKPIDSLGLLPTCPDWSIGLGKTFCPGESHALKKLNHFINRKISHYAELRDYPAENATSHLSPHLHFGEISPLQIFHFVQQIDFRKTKAALKFMSEIGWREFSAYLLYHFQNIATKNMNPKFNYFSWEKNVTSLKKWQKGLTGYPIVDAGMRELWHTGFMHNRVRMVVASFLTKDLLIHWKEGADWFMDTLVDADLASNVVNWQWVAGSGIDAAPYFRIFNPVSQSEKFDPDGKYIRRWIPEISKLSNQFIHKPWMASDVLLRQAKIILGKDYPYPIVNHEEQRKEALKRYKYVLNVNL